VPSALIEAAADLAASQKAPLHVVHVYDRPEVYGDLATKMMGTQNWAELIDEPYTAQEAKLQAHLAATHPDITVTVETKPGHPTTILRELSAQASVLVIARRAHAFPVGHFGHVGRSLLHTAGCPVEVLPVAEVSTPESEPTSLASATDR
jgi:nucleotide-binding universal stress UspA family protein